MKRSRFSDEQIIAVLKEQEAGMATADVCRRHGISSATIDGCRRAWLAHARAIVTRQGRDGEGGLIGASAEIERGPERDAAASKTGSGL